VTIAAGSPAPDFTAEMPDGTAVTLKDMRGKWVLLFFYPRDFTPGCTMESRSLNENLDRFERLGATVVGVSSQGRDSHEKFQAHHGLRYALVADSDRTVGDAYGVPIRGLTTKSSARVSFLVDPDGSIAEVWEKVSPKTHTEQVLKAIGGRKP
jgi:peroxiredoxin Q/BCP